MAENILISEDKIFADGPISNPFVKVVVQEVVQPPRKDSPRSFSGLLSIFSKPKPDRTEDDVKTIIHSLKTLQVFKRVVKAYQNEEEFLMNIYQSLNYETFNQDEAIIHYGETHSKFYVILDGMADLYVLQEKEKVEHKNDPLASRGHLQVESSSTSPERRKSVLKVGGEGSDFKHPKRNSRRKSVAFRIDNSPDVLPSTSLPFKIGKPVLDSGRNLKLLTKFPERYDLYVQNGQCEFKKSKSIGPGSFFGEECLNFSSEKLTNEAIMASSKVHLISLTKEDYQKCVDPVQKKMESKWDFLGKVFEDVSGETIRQLSENFSERSLKYGQEVFKQGDIPQEVYIISQGEVQVAFKIIVKYEEERVRNSITPSKNYLDDKKKRLVKRKVANLGPLAFLGEGEALSEKAYEMTAISISNDTRVYVITVQEFNRLNQVYKEIFEGIKQKYQAKAAHWNLRLHNITETEEKIQNDLFIPPSISHRHLKTETDLGDCTSRSLKLMKKIQDQISTQENAVSPITHSSLGRSNRNPPLLKVETKIFAFDTLGLDTQQETEEKEKPVEKIQSQNRRQLKKQKSIKTVEKSEKIENFIGNSAKPSIKASASGGGLFSIPIADTESLVSKEHQSASTLNKFFNPKLLIAKQSNRMAGGFYRPPQRIPTQDIEIPKKFKNGYFLDNFSPKINHGTSMDSRNEPSYTISGISPLCEEKIQHHKLQRSIITPKEPEENLMEAAPYFLTIKSQSLRKRDIVKSRNSSDLPKIKFDSPTSSQIIHKRMDSKEKPFEINLASLELASPFSRKNIPVSLSLNNFGCTSPAFNPFVTRTKFESLCSANSSIHDTEMFLTEKSFQPFPNNKPIATSKHNLFRVKPLRAHLSPNYNLSSIVQRERTRSKNC